MVRDRRVLPVTAYWLVAFAIGSGGGLLLRLAFFFAAALLLPAAGAVVAALNGHAPWLDPVYSRAAERTVFDLHVQGVALAGPPGAWLHNALPQVFVDSGRARWSLVRIVVEQGSPVLARLVAAAVAHAAVLGIGLLTVREGWRRRSSALAVAGVAIQLQVALGILGAQPTIRELESTGLSFAANALLPWLGLRGASVSQTSSRLAPPVVAAGLVSLALLVAYCPSGLVMLTRNRTRRLTLGTAAAIVLTTGACAGVVRDEETIALASSATRTESTMATVSAPVSLAMAAPVVLREADRMTAPVTLTARDRWYAEPHEAPVAGPSHVEIVGTGSQYQYLVNGRPEVIRGMGLNTQYAQQLSPADRAARLDADMAMLHDMGVNTVLGWDPAEFDEVLLDAAQRHGIGVIVPFDLDPEADYTDPQVRQTLHDQVVAWVARYRNASALRMWGLGNEVLHKIVHPAWVGPQDPRRERQAEAFSDWLVETADAIHALDPNHPVTYRSAEDAFVPWVAAALQRHGNQPRPWFALGTNCYQPYLQQIVDRWPQSGLPVALWVSEFAPGGMAVPDRPDGFAGMWGVVRSHPSWVLGGAVYAWTRNGPEGVDRNFGLTDDGAPVDGRSLDMLNQLFHSE